MAYNRNNAPSSNNEREFEKAKGFLNLSLPLIKDDGSEDWYHFPTGIPLRESKAEEMAFFTWLSKPGNVERALSKMRARFVPVNAGAKGRLALD